MMKKLLIILSLIVLVGCNNMAQEQEIKYNFDTNDEEDILLNYLDMSWVFLKDVKVNSVEEAINYTLQFDGVCRHYSTILYLLMHNRLNMSTTYLVSGHLFHLNGSDGYMWDDKINETKEIWVTKVSNHMWIYDLNYGLIDLTPQNESEIPVRIPIFAISNWDEWGWKTQFNKENTIAMYEYYLGMFELNNLPDIDDDEVIYQTTEDWLKPNSKTKKS